MKKLVTASILCLTLFTNIFSTEASTLDDFLKDPINQEAFNDFPPDVQEEMRQNDIKIKASEANELAALPAGTVSCFDHYTFGSIQVLIEPVTETPVSGSVLHFSGEIKNDNPYPIVSGTLFVKIFRKDQISEQASVDNGYPLVDQFIALRDITIPANGYKPASFVWSVPASLEGGDYYAAFYFSTHQKYNLAGIMFMDDVTGNQTDFTIMNTGKNSASVEFDRNNTTINGFEYNFSQLPRMFKKDESVEVSVKVLNPTDKTVTVPITWKLAPWGDLTDEKNLDTKNESVTLEPNETKVLTYEVLPHENTVSYVVVELIDNGIKSIQNIRFARDGVPETRLEFPTILKYPLTAGEETDVFVCTHSTNVAKVDNNEVILKVADEHGNTVFTHNFKGSIPVYMTGILGKFVPETTLTNFTLEATLMREGKLVETVKQSYSCHDFDSINCPDKVVFEDTEVVQPVAKNDDSNKIFLLGTVVFLLMVLLIYLARKNHQKKINSYSDTAIIFIMMLGFSLFGGIQSVEAKSITLPYMFHNDPYSDGSYTTDVFGGYGVGNYLDYPSCSSGSFLRGDGTLIYSVVAINEDTGTVINDGATVAVGTPIRFKLQFNNDYDTKTISWKFINGCIGSPTGAWVVGAARSGTTPLSINPPSTNVIENSSGSTILTCSTQTDCTVTSTGVSATTISFGATYGRFYRDYPEIAYDSEGLNPYPTGVTLTEVMAFPITATSIKINFSAVATNAAPDAPTISGSNTGNTGGSIPFTFTASDPDGDQVRYGVDWNNNGTVDQWLPSTAYVNSGTLRNAAYTWGSVGTYTFRARTQDSNGGLSPWASHTVNIALSLIPTIQLNFAE